MLTGFPFSRRGLLALPFAASLAPAESFPTVPAIDEPHFPSRLYQYVWRNWELANLDRMAQVVGAQPGQLAEMGRAMGLAAARLRPSAA